ncbi:cation transporter [Thalassotalea sp. HSM 43]|uniref:cation transporter n=1 Tax=Thalassotalea sp. HSM 43 TaxID=2552945 RepID=UPI0010800348|nr:cation transporter [Thalassotalea sp. HSM 43]QBY05911.1 cation transporter [Thalassotalea sp. HSM 43]
MSGCGCEVELKDNQQKTVLYWLLAINAIMFVFEIGFGWISESTALIADSLDMLADAIVYAIALYAVGKSIKHKANAALVSGYCQLALGVLILLDIGRRLYGESEPHSWFMISIGMVALVANVICLILIRKHNNDDVHMRASWIFSANDVIANLGVIIAGVLVMTLEQRWPDIVIGSIISVLILRGAYLILTDAKQELRTIQKPDEILSEDKQSTSCCSK